MTWEPLLHLLAVSTTEWIDDHYKTRATCVTECGVLTVGYIDDANKHVVTCLTCLVGARWW